MRIQMKNGLVLITLVLALASIGMSALRADEPKPDKNNGRLEIEILPGFQLAPLVKKPVAEPRLFLGVGLAEVPEIVREQLTLPAGVGVAISLVMKDGPASKAGVKAHDILLKLDEQPLVSAAQLQTLVSNKKEGDMVSITVLSRGKEVKLAVKLEMGQGDVIGNRNALQRQRNFRWFQGGLAIPPNLPPAGPQIIDPQALLKRFQLDPNFEIQPGQPDGQGLRFNVQSQHSSMSSVSDESGKYTFTNRNGKKHFKAENNEGKPLFHGEVDTDEQRKGIPAEILPKLESLEKSARLNLPSGPRNPAIEKKIEPKKKAPSNDERA